MPELPFELQKLPPSALDVLRFFATNSNEPADEIDIMDGADLSERSFSKAIKRLITKKFADMDINRMYTLTEKGKDIMAELVAYDAEMGDPSSEPAAADPDPAPAASSPVQRRLTLVVPRPMIAGEDNPVYIGLNEGIPNSSSDMVLRLAVLNGTPESQESTLRFDNGTPYTAFQVAVGSFTQIRLAVQALQADEFSGDLHIAGGMYVDVDVTAENIGGELAAYGTDVTVLP